MKLFYSLVLGMAFVSGNFLFADELVTSAEESIEYVASEESASEYITKEESGENACLCTKDGMSKSCKCASKCGCK